MANSNLSFTDLLRGDYIQPEYGKVTLTAEAQYARLLQERCHRADLRRCHRPD